MIKKSPHKKGALKKKQHETHERMNRQTHREKQTR